MVVLDVAERLRDSSRVAQRVRRKSPLDARMAFGDIRVKRGCGRTGADQHLPGFIYTGKRRHQCIEAFGEQIRGCPIWNDNCQTGSPGAWPVFRTHAPRQPTGQPQR